MRPTTGRAVLTRTVSGCRSALTASLALLDTARPWETLSDDEKRLFIRTAEVFAGYVEYTDDEVGRVIDFLGPSGRSNNTIIVVISDNGASGEGDRRYVQRVVFLNGVPTPTEAATLEHIDARWAVVVQPLQHRLGLGVRHALPYWKRWAGYEGGIADMCLVSWPAEVAASTTVRRPVRSCRRHRSERRSHELIGITPRKRADPQTGYQQRPIEGESFAASLTQPQRPASAPSST